MAYERFNANNAAMLLIDHQVGTIGWMHSAPHEEVKRNTLAHLSRILSKEDARTMVESSAQVA